MTYDERRAKLREFNVRVTLSKRDHEPRFAVDWAFDLTSWDVIDQEAEPWIIYTRESLAPHANSLGCFDNKNSPVVRLRWTDRDLVSLAAD